MVWVTLCQLNTMHGYFYQEPTGKTPQWKFVPCLEASSLFQSVADASHSSLMMKFLCGIFWSLFSFPNVLEVESIWKWGSDKTCSPLLVRTVNGFLCKKKTSIFELLVITVPISSNLTSAHLLLKDKWFAQGLRASGKTSGWALWWPPLVHVQNCACVHRSFEEAVLLPRHFKSNIHRC